MLLDVCLDCGRVHQSVGDLHYYCSSCHQFTWHAIIQEDYRNNAYKKEDFDLENFCAGGL